MNTNTKAEQLKELAHHIREGAKLRPQVFNRYYDTIENGEIDGTLGSCAMGAALESVAGHPATDVMERLRLWKDRLPGLDVPVKHPESGKLRYCATAIQHLSDKKLWSREQIADWIDAQAGEVRNGKA